VAGARDATDVVAVIEGKAWILYTVQAGAEHDATIKAINDELISMLQARRLYSQDAIEDLSPAADHDVAYR